MKRNWDTIRAVLIAIEDDNYDEYLEESENQDVILKNTALLIQAGFIDGKVLDSLDMSADVVVNDLTWQGHELLDTVRSKPVWDKIKSTALDKGLELTFDTVRAIGAKVIELMIGN
ncbi:DUF2513 domain-containing protein [Acinetobacter baumannii]|uniref:DUF2513 domain-containing protein n=2 Tax=Acinetobacter baumannii TaxID=470 RepID=UPI0004475A3C|nr:DUF2513 domain-containing protein [Acinetobacter baumannii]EXE39229.1 hypothetical protein J573_1121 [Acinetobacter baumannii 1546444]MCR0006402.1 DUF2513 domain-containing protein [Acinetobacter baumannii]MCT9288253.1 DUF2513 domain-containing protein [Acinetobacter baumannii]MDC4918262.1 DUF2513 domain-containing protein [Acinetobacter baumannii]MDC4932787.1 DUF2513 domain-containing protein [Acinetobacter baumannii]